MTISYTNLITLNSVSSEYQALEDIKGGSKEPHELGLEVQEMRRDLQKGCTYIVFYMYNNLLL